MINDYHSFIEDLRLRLKFDVNKHLHNRLSLLKKCKDSEEEIRQIQEIISRKIYK